MVVLAFAAFAASIFAPQGDPPTPPAATPAKPRIEWQRTLADALAVQQATGLPLLIAVNMDGEVFNESFATVTYRDPAFVAMTRGYVCVVASPDRHTPSDYDALGNRIECPRFPGCTCSEHQAIEPELFARWFNGTRNAPRHVGVDQAGKVLFDRFLDPSMQTAIDAIEKHMGDAKRQPGPSEDVAELFPRRDALARRAIEARWRNGDRDARRQLLAAAAKAPHAPTDLLRAALRDDDDDVLTAAAALLAQRAGKDAVIDVEDALARVTEPAVVAALVARLAELGKDDKAAARLALHFTPGEPSRVGKPWGNDWVTPRWNPADRGAVEVELDRCEAALRANPADDATRLDLAIAQVALAELLANEGAKGPELWFGDAIANAQKLTDPALAAEAQAVVAYARTMTGDSEAAAKALPLAWQAVQSARQPSAFLAARLLEADVLTTVAAAFTAGDQAATRSQRAEIDRVLADLALLRTRGGASERTLLTGIALLEFGGLRRQARALLDETAQRFPASPAVHERWRNRMILDLGFDAARRAYAAFVAAAKDAPTAQWFAGLCALLAGDQHTRDRRPAAAIAAYDEAIERFTASSAGNADFADSANHYTVQALAGRAELRNERGDAEAAAADLLRAAELRPASLDTSDGLERKPRAIAGRVARALEQAGNTELAAKLKPLLP